MKGVKEIKKEIWEAIAENQMLLRNMKCNLGNSKFKIELTNEFPVFTRQYPISKKMSRKVVEKVKE
jgi:hypothetical protein